jgi:hypothetical protein
MDYENIPPDEELNFDFDASAHYYLPPPVVESTLYQMMWRANLVAPHAQNAQELATRLFAAAEEMQRMADAGIVLLGAADVDSWPIGANNSEVAKAFGFDVRQKPGCFFY